jgi:periplasmic protein TonB
VTLPNRRFGLEAARHKDIVLPPEPAPAPRVAAAAAPPSARRPDPNLAPVQAPDTIVPERLEEVEPAQPVGTVTGLGDATSAIAEPLPPPPPPPVKTDVPRPVGGDIRPPTKIKDVRPEYPPLAIASRTQGIVIVETTIGVDGRVINARVLRSVPLLDDAALAAVRQWEFTPTLLNGTPVPVVMTVTVNFQLN